MALDDTPNKLESVWVQRNPLNQFYEQINVSGSDLIIYHSSSGELQADKISVWAAKYGLGGASSGTTVKVSVTDTTAGYLVAKITAGPNITINQDNVGGYETLSITASASGGGSGDFASGSLFASASLFASSSLFASASLSASWASSSYSSSLSQTASLAYTIAVSDNQDDVNFNIPFVTTNGTNVYIDDGAFTYNAFTNKLSVGDITAIRLTGSLFGTASQAISSSWADSAGSASSAFVAETVTVYPQASGQWHLGLLATNAGVVNVYADGNGDALWDASTKALIAPAITSSLYGTASFAVSASYAATSSLVTNGQSYVVPFEDNINVVAGGGLVFTFGANAGSYNFSNIPISASLFFGDLQGTASQAISASYAPSTGGGTTLETGSFYPISSSWAETASAALTSSYVWNTGSQMVIIDTPNYLRGTKVQALSQSYSEVLTFTMNPNSNVYVKLTMHGVDPDYGAAVYLGEFFVQKDADMFVAQPGSILSQHNNNLNVNIQANIPDVAYTTGSAVMAIQLKTTLGAFTGSLIYEVQGLFQSIGGEFTSSYVANVFGDTFETYPLGYISTLDVASEAFGAPAPIRKGKYGVVVIENINTYPSGSSPSLTGGDGWSGPGLIT